MAVDPTIRPARSDDAPAVESFTADTWPEHGGDYFPRVFDAWVAENERGTADPVAGRRTVEAPVARTLVADVDGRAVGLLRTMLLGPEEAWCGGMRVAPDYRGRGVALGLVEAGLDWAGDRGASVARVMVFSWNAAGLGVARAAGFDPAVEFRWVHPDPAGARDRADDPTADASTRAHRARPDPEAVWAAWQRSECREHLHGLALDRREPWALSTLTREGLVEAADAGRLLVVRDRRDRADAEPPGGFAVRVRVREYPETDRGGPERWAEYGVAHWTDEGAAADLLAAIARDAAAVGADRTRVLIPETVRAVSDVALARVAIADAPDFVLAATPRA